MSNSPAAGRPSPVNAGGVATATRCSLDGCGRARQHGVVAARSCARCVVAPVALGVHQVALRPVECALGAGGVIEEEADVATLARRRLLAAPRPTHRALSQARKERGRSESEKSVRAEETERASIVACTAWARPRAVRCRYSSHRRCFLVSHRCACPPPRQHQRCAAACRIAAASFATLASAAAAMRSAARAAAAAAAAAAAGSGALGRTMRSGIARWRAAYSLVLPMPTQLSRLLRRYAPRQHMHRRARDAADWRALGSLKDTTAASAEHRHVSIALRGRLHQQRPHQRRAGAANHLRLDVLDLMRGSVSIIIGTKHHRSARGLRTRQHGREVARACVAGWQRLTPRAAPSSAATLSSVVANAVAASASCRSRASCSRGVSSGTSRSPAGATASAKGGGVAMLTAER